LASLILLPNSDPTDFVLWRYSGFKYKQELARRGH